MKIGDEMNFLKSKKIKFLMITQFFIISMVSSSITIVQSASNTTNLTQTELEQQMSEADLVAIFDPNATTNIVVDGSIGINEYPEIFYSNYTHISVGIAHNGTHLFVALAAPTLGYVAIGFNHEGFGMIGSDIKAGWVVGNETSVTDQFATQYAFPGKDGNNDVVASNGQETNTTTTIEFISNMVSKYPNGTFTTESTPDENKITRDIDIVVNNTYSMLLASGPDADQGVVLHTKKGISTLFIAPPGVAPRKATNIAFSLTGETSGSKETMFTGTATIKDSDNNPISGVDIGVYLQALISDVQLTTAKTDSTGVALFNFSFLMEYSSEVALVAKFIGNINLKKSTSNAAMISYTGHVEKEEAPYLIIPTDYDFLVPWLTGLSAIATVGFMWIMFGFVIYTVLFKNAVQPDEKKSKGGN